MTTQYERVLASIEMDTGSARPAVSVCGSRAPSTHWSRQLVRRLAVTDALSVVASVAIAQLMRFGTDPVTIKSLDYTVVSGVLVVAWLGVLSLFRSRDSRVVGHGADEYRRVTHASTALFGAVAIVAYLLKLELARGYLAVALPIGLSLLLLTRLLWRWWLAGRRARGRFVCTVLVVGSHRAAVNMANNFERTRSAGYRVVGVCVPGWGTSHGDSLELDAHRVPVLGDATAIVDALKTTRADMVAVSNTEYLGAEGMRALGWQLEAMNVDLVVSPGVVDVAGPRLQLRPVAGLPLLHVERPQYRGASKARKSLVDFGLAAAGLVLLSPLLVIIAAAIKVESRGPVFYRAERIGLNGRPFPMFKFRSMVVQADLHRIRLLDNNEGAGPLFKMRSDPRVTRVGKRLRRLSLDELPQLINVLLGQMSIVGPRPPLLSEVVTYTGDVHRRLLVKPGITGLWQVSGRSDLSWEESVRLDLFYVENWSMIQDLIIVIRTITAVLRSRGAY